MTNRGTKIYLTILIAIAGALLALVAAPSPAQPALADLPPRTPRPTPTFPAPPVPSAPQGARLELRIQFPETISYPWQELWTVVQWLDEDGYWRDVAGWQGSLDSVADGVGTKTWWVAKDDLGRGPFRWRVYRSKGGWLLAQSDEFDLPSLNGGTVTVQVSLGP